MCERFVSGRRPKLGVLICCIVPIAAVPSAASGQTIEEYRTRIESLVHEWEAALEAERRARGQDEEPDTVRAAALTLLTRRRDTMFVKEVAGFTWEVIGSRLGPDTLLLRGDPLIVRSFTHLDRETWVVRNRRMVQFWPEDDPQNVAERVVRELGAQLAERLDPLSSRLLCHQLPLQALPADVRERVYVNLATADSRAARLCLQGDVPSCGDALAITELDEPLTVWYGPEERRRLVERRRKHRRIQSARVDDCMEGGDDAACLDILRSFPMISLMPLGSSARRMLVNAAVELGGDGAYARLIEAQAATLERRVAAAARLGSDSVLAVWRSAVLSSRPQRSPVTGTLLWTAVWVVVLGFVATRSTRWR